MQIINDKTVVVSTNSELKEILEADNNYLYIYLDNDITLESGITINENKKKIIIDGTYQNITHTYTNFLTDLNEVITSLPGQTITIKNLTIKSTHSYGVIATINNEDYKNNKIVFSNITFNGVKLSYNHYGITKILNSNITIESTNNVDPQRVCDCNNVLIGGKTTISSYNTCFLYQYLITPAIFYILSNSDVSITTSNAFFNGTPRLDFKVLHNSTLNLVTGNGFAQTVNNGCQDVLIDSFSTLNFIENSHQRVPMWNVYGNFTVNESANLYIINTYETTPIDNFNIRFKGNNQNLTFNNPKNIIFYNKNANIIYVENVLNFNFTFNRINMWNDSVDYINAGTLSNLPDYFFNKEDSLSIIKGSITSTSTTITESNFTKEDKQKMSDLSNFSFQNKKQFSVGMPKINIHPLNTSSKEISGHTLENSNILITYDSINETLTSDINGLFEYTLNDSLTDNKEITITASPTNFIFNTRKITTPFDGELTLLKTTEVSTFNPIPISTNPTTYAREKQIIITIIDSRLLSTNWKLYIYYLNPMNNNKKIISNSLIFKTFENEEIPINLTPKLIYQDTSNNGNITKLDLTYSKDKALLFRHDDDIELDDEYKTYYIFSILP